jgi:predicted translin family RNA/ssDNA-binding protein
MEELPRISAEALKAMLHGKVDEIAEKVITAMNAAKPGRLIADSEEQVRDIMGELRRAVFETAVQQKVDAAEAAFSPSGESNDRPASA